MKYTYDKGRNNLMYSGGVQAYKRGLGALLSLHLLEETLGSQMRETDKKEFLRGYKDASNGLIKEIKLN